MPTPDILAGQARAQDGVAVHHDGKKIGFILSRREGIEAITIRGRALGRFNTEIAAAGALLHEARS